ncbi:MAG: CBS domain-containing protein [Verrucomicrobia bacterium]|nr:CBS domain-containing protein [Verrucomicrobiota bacterium]
MKSPLSTLLSEKQGSVYSVSPNTTVQDAAQMMNDHHIGSVVVLDETKLVGIFTERDVLKRIVMKDLDPSNTLVSQVMTKKITTVSPTTSVHKAMEMMATLRLRHLPVMKDDKLVGVISIRDLTGYISQSFKFETDTLWSFITGDYPNTA